MLVSITWRNRATYKSSASQGSDSSYILQLVCGLYNLNPQHREYNCTLKNTQQHFKQNCERWRRVEMTRAHGTDQDLWSHWAAAGTGDGFGEESVPDGPRTREGRTAAGFEHGGGQHFTALFKYASKAFREIVHIFNMQEYKPNTAILPT